MACTHLTLDEERNKGSLEDNIVWMAFADFAIGMSSVLERQTIVNDLGMEAGSSKKS
jgi:hypothetical protein